jgi:hypothetical protein
VVLINNRIVPFILLLPLPIITGVVAASLRRRYFNLSKTIPYETAQAVDVGNLRAAIAQDDMPPFLGRNISTGSFADSDSGAAPLDVPELSKPPAVGSMLGHARGMYHGEAPPVPPSRAPTCASVIESSNSGPPPGPRRPRPPVAGTVEQLPLCDVARDRSDGNEVEEDTTMALAAPAVAIIVPQQPEPERQASWRSVFSGAPTRI